MPHFGRRLDGVRCCLLRQEEFDRWTFSFLSMQYGGRCAGRTGREGREVRWEGRVAASEVARQLLRARGAVAAASRVAWDLRRVSRE